jgi:hypothetical protein
MASILCTSANNVLNHIVEAYYFHGIPKIPSDRELKTIESDMAEMSLAGKFSMIGGGVGLAVTCGIWAIPVGPVLAVVTGVMSVAAGFFGYDLHKASRNLQEFVNKRIQNFGANILREIKDTDSSKDDFKKELIKTAAKGTILLGILYDASLLAKNLASHGNHFLRYRNA